MAKVLIYSPHPLKKAMSGPAIRTWEFAKALSSHHRVVLLSNGIAECQSDKFEFLSFQDPSLKSHFQTADILVTQRLTVQLARLCSRYGVRVIIDAYDPSPLELMEIYKAESLKQRHQKISSEISTLQFNFKMADGILCASEKQRDLWAGFLLAQKMITPSLYDRDPSLKLFVGLVPFGLSCDPPKKNGMGLREKFGFTQEDKILLWGGGIWNWFDPLTLIKAMKSLSSRKEIKLVFMGIKSPDTSLPSMRMAEEAILLSNKLELTDCSVFFNQDWVPYHERQNYLLDADIGISTHFDHLETHFSFRTRLLDYLWAELPIISTMGDSFAELIERHQLGSVVPPENEKVLADTIIDLLNDQEKQRSIKQNIHFFKEKFYWQSVIIPLEKMINHLASLEGSKKRWHTNKALFQLIINKFQEKGMKACLQKGKELFQGALWKS